MSRNEKNANTSAVGQAVDLNTLRTKLTATQSKIFDQVWCHYVSTGKPLPIRSLQPGIGKARIEEVLIGVSGGLIYESTVGTTRCLNLSMLGALLAREGEFLFQILVRLLKLVADLYEADSHVQCVSSNFANEKLGLAEPGAQNIFLGFLKLGLPSEAPLFVSGWGDDGNWGAQVTDYVVNLFTAENIPDYVESLLLASYKEFEPWSEKERLQKSLSSSPFPEGDSVDWLLRVSGTPARPNLDKSVPFVSPSRLEQIRELKSANFDCSRLVLMCTELDECAKRENAHAVIMLLRAIIDHVPPIFGYKTFREVANNYSGRRSFKEAMANLESFLRKIADLYLHSAIQRSESLPTMTQVNFSPALDLLLAEIVALLGSGSMSSQ